MSPNSKDLEAFTKAVIEEGKVGSDLKTIALALNIDLGKLFTMARRSPEFKLALMQATKHAVEYWEGSRHLDHLRRANTQAAMIANL